jgi:hypothetical protein
MPDPMTPDPREAKLPAWVRDQLGDLRREVRNTRRERDDAVEATSPRDSVALIDVGQGSGRQWIGLPSHRGLVRFLLGEPGDVDGPHVEVYVSDGKGWTSGPGGVIEVRGSESIGVLPQSGNLVRVEVRSR